MKMLKKMLTLLLVLAMTLSFAGCGRLGFGYRPILSDDKDVNGPGYRIYYISQDETQISSFSYQLASTTIDGIIQECLEALKTQPDNERFKPVLAPELTLIRYKYDKDTAALELYFDSSYTNLEKTTEILIRAAIVKTMTQFIGLIDYVYIKVNDTWISDAQGNPLPMKDSDFEEEITSNLEHLDDAELTLYFAGVEGTGLTVVETTQKYYNTTPLTEVVLDTLIRGPVNENCRQVLSPNTRVRSVSLKDGTCKVDFNNGFLERVGEQDFSLNVYSVVNSLSELDGVDVVEITVGGETVKKAPDGVTMDRPLIANPEMMEKTEETETETEKD